MQKVYELDTHFNTGEATVQPVLLWGANGRPLRESFSKTASEAGDYIRSVQPQPGKTIVLVLALGAYETYDLNRNGDGFNEFPYRTGMKVTCGHAACQKGDAWVSRGELITDHYKSFEQFGKVYKHHVNKDPAKSYGDVIKAFWNPQMHRVELLLGIDNDKAPDIVQRIADGEYPAVSMGCRISYDVCTVCGHRAPTRAQYCDHLKFGMRQVTSSGLRAGALNPTPKFFDISFVVKPADQTGYMLKKVANVYEIRSSAELGEKLAEIEEKRAAIRKVSDIDKTIRGVTLDAKSSLTPGEQNMLTKYRDAVALPDAKRAPVLSRMVIKKLSAFPVHDTLASLGHLGVQPTTSEIIQLVVQSKRPGTTIPEDALDRATFMMPLLYGLLEAHPDLIDAAREMHSVPDGKVDPVIVGTAAKYLEKRSSVLKYIGRKLIPTAAQVDPPTTDPLHAVDPLTGHRYVTNRGAAMKAEDAESAAQLSKMIGGAALLAAAHKVVAGMVPREYHPLTAASMIGLGAYTLPPRYGPRIVTEEGVTIPARTEMVRENIKQSMDNLINVGVPALAATGLVSALAHDYESRLNRGEDLESPYRPLSTRIYDTLAHQAHHSPLSSILGTLLVYGAGRQALSKFASYVDPVVGDAPDSVTAPPVNFDLAASRVGALIW